MKILILAILFISQIAMGDAVIFSGNDVKALKYNLDLFGRSKVMGLNVDPSAGAGIAAPLGSFGMDYLTGEIYYKYGAANTQWRSISGAITGTANTFAGYDSSGDLNPIPTWQTADYSGVIGVNHYGVYTVAADVGSATYRLHDYQTEINPAVASSQQTVIGQGFDIHLDRTGSGNDFDAPIIGLQNVVSAEGNGHSGSVTGQYNNTVAGVGSGTGNTDNLYNLSLNTSVGTGYTVNNILYGIQSTISNDGTLANSTAIDINDTADVTTNKSGIIYNNAGDATNFSGLYMANTGTHTSFIGLTLTDAGANTNSTLLNGYVSGNSSNDFNGYSLSHSGTVGNNAKLINIQSSGAITNDIVGGFFNLQNAAITKEGIQVNTSGTVSNYLAAISVNNTGDMTNSGRLIDLTNSGNADSFTGINVYNDGDTTTQMNGAYIGIGGTHDGGMTGLTVDVSQAVVNPSLSNPLGRKITAQFGDGAIQSNGSFQTVSNYPALVDGGNILSTQLSIVSGSPITGTDFLGNNLAGGLFAEDDYSPSAFGLGWAAVGLVGQVAVASGKTVDKASFMVAGGSIPVQSTGGTVTDLTMYEALGAVSAGGTLTATNMYGFRYLNALGFTPTNEWGVSIDNANADNYFAKSINIGTSSHQVASSDVAFEIGSLKAILNPRLTTAERNALTAIEGMSIYNTTTKAFEYYDGTSWVNSSITTPVSVANGGTGQSSLTANNVILGNGTSAVQFVAPGTSGNVLTSNGTTWVSSAPSSGGGYAPDVMLDWIGTQSISHNTWSKLTYPSGSFSKNVNFTYGSGTFTATVEADYDISCQWNKDWVSDAAVTRWVGTAIYVNGAELVKNGIQGGLANNAVENFDVGVQASVQWHLAIGDYFECYAYQSNDAANAYDAVRANVSVSFAP